MKKDSLFYTVAVTALAAFLFVFLLSLANSATKERVNGNNRILMAKAYLKAVGIDVADDSNVEEKFKSVFPDFDADEPIHKTVVAGETVLVAPFQGNGLWGTITGVLGMNGDCTRIVGMEILSHSETPGLGGRIDEAWFKNQFSGENVSNGLQIVRGTGKGDTNPENGEVDGITGATRTSDSLQVIINQQIKFMKSAAGGNGNE